MRVLQLSWNGCQGWLVGVASAILLAGCSTIRVPAPDTLIAHRGESFDAPENTIAAYRTAVERGFGFECDIYRSKDGRFFTFHDGNLTRTTDGRCTNRCVDVTWADLAAVNVGGWGKWKGTRFDPMRPALLEEVLDLARPGRKIYVEVKADDASAAWVPEIRDVVRRHPKASPETVLFIAFGRKTCAELKRLMPEYKVYLLVGGPIKPVDQVLSMLRDCGADGVDEAFIPSLITEDYIRTVKEAGYEFHAWTIDDPEIAELAFRRGADTVTTNRAKAILESHNKSTGGK